MWFIFQENDNYIMDSKNIKPQKVVSIPVPLFESMQGRYFVCQIFQIYPMTI